MTLEEALRTRLPIELILDTNAALRHRSVIELCELVARLREPPFDLILRVCVPAPAHMEMLHDLRVKYGPRFDQQKVDHGLLAKGIEVLTFDEAQAALGSRLLHDRFPRPEAWSCIGPAETRQVGGLTNGG